jgi:transaldolase
MTRLQRQYTEHGQTPRLDNLTRGYLSDGTLARLVAKALQLSHR